VEFHLRINEIQFPGKMTEGTVPVLHTAPALHAIVTNYLFMYPPILGEWTSGGIKIPVGI